MVAEKGKQKGSADFGRRSSPKNRTTDKVICTPTWCTAKSSAVGCISLFLVEIASKQCESEGDLIAWVISIWLIVFPSQEWFALARAGIVQMFTRHRLSPACGLILNSDKPVGHAVVFVAVVKL